MRSKKGAIEMSMTTIIVIVLGVTLLILGLAFVKGVFENVNILGDQAFTQAQKEIQQRMGASDKIYIPGIEFKVESGKSSTITVGIQNFATNDETTASVFSVQIEVGESGGKKEWFTLPPKQTIPVGDKKGLPLGISIPKGTQPGKNFTFTIKVLKGTEVYDSQGIIVTAK